MNRDAISASATRSDLFAAKGQAAPACVEAPVAHQSHCPTPGAKSTGGGAPGGPEQDGPEGDGAGSVLTINLRRTNGQAVKPVPRVSNGARSVHSTAPTYEAPRQSGTGRFIALAASIAVGAGLFYTLTPDRVTLESIFDEFNAVLEPADTPAGNLAGDGTAAPAKMDAVAPVSAPDGKLAQQGPEPADGRGEEKAYKADPAPSFDLIRVEPDGAAVIAGRAAPYSELVLLHNGEPIGTVKADWAGEWAFVTDKPLRTDRHQLSLLVNDPAAAVTLPAAENQGPR